MSKTYKIKVNQGADSAKFVDIPQVGTSGKALTVKAVPGGKYQLMDASTGFAPENIRATRLGKDLQVFFEGRGQADLVIEDYYEVTPEGFNGLIGEAESGRFYEYIPESAVGNTAVPLLADGSTQVGMALGGAEINASGAAVGALVAAAGLNPLLLAPLALLGAAAGGGGSSGAAAAGGGGGGGGVTDNKSAIVKITKATEDTGVSGSDFVTKGPVTEFSGTLSNFTGTPGDKVKLQLLDKDGKPLDPVLEGTVTPTALNGVWTWKWTPVDKDATTNLPELLKDGNYTLKATIVTSTGIEFTHATANATQALNIDNRADGPNTNARVEILSITHDSGPSDSDFYTNDQTLVFKGNYTTFTPNGDLIKLELKNENGEVVDTKYIRPEGVSTTAQNGSWTWDRTDKAALPEGKYTLFATVVDTAGNPFSGKADQAITIDLTGGKEGSGQVSITKMSVDSGIGVSNHDSRSDFKTNDNTPKFEGKVENSTGVQWLEVRLHNVADGTNTSKDLITTIEVKAGTTDWTWAPPTPATGLPDAKYKLTAQVVDQAGNPLTDSNSKPIYSEKDVVIDTRGPVGPDDTKIPTDPNEGFVLTGFKLKDGLDSGSSKQDFITNTGKGDSKLVFEGNIANSAGGKFEPNAGNVWVQVINKKDGAVFSEGFATFDSVNSTAWEFKTNADIETEGTYIVRASLLDQAFNKVSTMDEILVIDRTISDTIAVTSIILADGKVSKYLASADEHGTYSYTGLNNPKLYKGGVFDLEGMVDKYYQKNTYKLIFTDLAGNSVSVSNNIDWTVTAATADLGKNLGNESLPKPGFTSAQPSVTGDIGTIEINGSSVFDMSVLYDGIASLTNLEKGAVNHVDMTATAAQKIDLSIQDILSLGVEDSFKSDLTHKDKVQMRIDGTSSDTVNFSENTNEIGAWKIAKGNTYSLEGLPSSEQYWLATNETYGLEVFIRKDMIVTGNQLNIL